MLHALWAEAIDIQRLAGDAASGGRQLAQLATIAGRLLSSRNGPRIAVPESLGRDTPTNHVVRLVRKLTKLDAALAALETALVARWAAGIGLNNPDIGRPGGRKGNGGPTRRHPAGGGKTGR